MYNIDDQIKEAQKKVAELEEAKKAYDALSPAQRVADFIHATQCRAHHDDGCSWLYESWESIGYSRSRYLEKAQALLEIEPNERHLIDILSCLEFLRQ